MLISFAWTTPALLAGRKTCTRRTWAASHAAKFKIGTIVSAYDRLPRIGGRKVATIRITTDPILERLASAPLSDFDAEGFRYFSEHPERAPQNPAAAWIRDITSEDAFRRYCRLNDALFWTVRFELVEVCDA